MSTKLKIAVADDEPDVLEFYQVVLPEMGHEVIIAAHDGQELVEACRATRPQLIIADVRMPHLDGIDAIREICQGGLIPAIIVSGHHDPTTIERAETEHVLAYLVKPVREHDLRAAIGIAMRRFEQFETLRSESANLRQAVEDRKTIVLATRILMKQLAVDEEQAFERLQELSRTEKRALVGTARTITSGAPEIVHARKKRSPRVLVTGSCGLIGSQAVRFYDKRAEVVVGIDNNLRAEFFGVDGDTTWMRRRLEAECPKYRHHWVDIRHRDSVAEIVAEVMPDLIIHCAAQPSHDLAARLPFVDFEVNAYGTLVMLEAARAYVPESVFIFMSTNKVYGDAPNTIKLRELPTRFDYDDPQFCRGIPETLSIDQSKHSLFGASKVAADLMVQEFGRYFGMKTCVFRGGCLTGAGHSAAELHGYLAYIFKAAATGKHYTIYGYKGKQVRDQIHSADVLEAFDAFFRNPRCGAVYNLGGGKANSISMIETIDRLEQLLNKKVDTQYTDKNRIGDHICYYSDLTKFQHDYPNWRLSRSLDDIFDEFARVSAASRA